MSLVELLLITAPALVVVAAAVRLATSERGDRDRDTVVDLRDVPTVVLATRDATRPTQLAPVRGALVHPGGGGTLGARMRSVPTAAPAHPEGERGAAPAGGVVRAHRRRRPLVAVTRERSTI